MKQISSFKKRIECRCGRVHECAINDVVIGRGALEQAAGLLKDICSVLIVSDANTRPLCFDRLTAGLKDAGIRWTHARYDTESRQRVVHLWMHCEPPGNHQIFQSGNACLQIVRQRKRNGGPENPPCNRDPTGPKLSVLPVKEHQTAQSQ